MAGYILWDYEIEKLNFFFFSKQTKLKLWIFMKDITKICFQENFFENYTTPKLNINLNLKSSSLVGFIFWKILSNLPRKCKYLS